MVSVLDSGSRGPGSSPGGSLCCVRGQNTLLSKCLSSVVVKCRLPAKFTGCKSGYRWLDFWLAITR